MKNDLLAPALALVLLFLTPWSARAADYAFPGALPGGCTNQGNGNYLCGALTLGAGDTVTVASPKPATVTFTGALTAGAGVQINTAGSASDLTFIANGFSLGVNVVMNGNLTSVLGAGLIGAGSKITGNVTTAAGVLSVGDYVTITGNVNTLLGAVNLGANNIISGNIKTLEGVVTIGADSTISGFIESGAGATILGANNMVGKYILTLAGKVDVGAGSTVIGNIDTAAGVVTMGADVIVGGNINTGAGAINIGDASRICGSINTLLGGVITLTTNVKVGGGISTLVGGAITIGGGSTVKKNIQVLAAGVITLTRVDVGGSISSAIGVITLTDSHVGGSVRNLYSILFGWGIVNTNSTVNDTNLTISPACSAAPVFPPLTTAASFDALETNTNTPWSATGRKPLYTKLVGAPFTLDIAALKSDGTLESGYVASGAANKYVWLELFDVNANVGVACSAYANAVATQTAAFASASSGRTLSGPFTVPDAYRSLLVRIKECTTSACTAFTSTTPACSSDRFAVRPSAPTLTATGAPIIAAGAPFTLLASMAVQDVKDIKDVKYVVLKLDASKLTPLSPSTVRGTLTPPALTANVAATATYSEVGYLTIGAGAYRDDDFTAVDTALGDCINSTTSDANLADTLSNGALKYGCSIGNKDNSLLGRFKPDHFSTVIEPGIPMPCPVGRTCPAAGFVYSGQPFTVTITALSLNGAATANYNGSLAHDVTLAARNKPDEIASPAGSVLSPTAVTAATFVSGVARLNGLAGAANASPVYTFPVSYPNTPLAAPTAIYLRATEVYSDGIKGDGVTSLRDASSFEAGITVLSGRIKVDNNYGSELLAVPIKAAAQYWDGLRFVNSTTDDVSSFSANDIVRSNCKLRINNIPVIDPTCKIAPATALSPAMNKMTKGTTKFKLAAPGAGNTGSVDLSINSSTSPWLPSTKARIGEGVYKAGPVIYLRENY